MKQLAEFVKERRKEVNLTQEEFAERAGIALTVVRKIELRYYLPGESEPNSSYPLYIKFDF
jgi:transcriptional regulator with XRE-family HTH domain